MQNHSLMKKLSKQSQNTHQNQSNKNQLNHFVQQDQNLLRQLVKKVIKQKSQQIKLLKKRQNAHISKIQTSKLNDKNQNDIFKKINIIQRNTNNLKNPRHTSQNYLSESQIHCKNCSNCNCRKHLCKIKYSQKDPSSKFISIYKKNSKQVQANYNHQKPQIIASYISDQISKIPIYNPKFKPLYFQSEYTKDYHQNQSHEIKKDANFNHLKLSNIKLGEKNLKFSSHFQSAYNLEYKQKSNFKEKDNNPFIVNNPENLNTFGLKYHSTLSNYGNAYKNQNKIVKRIPLKPSDKFKQLDLYLIKQTGYQEQFSQKQNKNKEVDIQSSFSHKRRHLSSSFSKLEPINTKQILQSSYKKQFNPKQIKQYACPCNISN